MNMIALLPEERWHELEEIISDEFDSLLPNKGKANIIADFDDDGRIQSFLIAEHLLRLGQLHSEGNYPRELMRWTLSNIPPDTSVIAIASQPRYGRLYERLHFSPVEGQIYRREF